MVWELAPIDSVRGTQRYCIFAAGTYKVGRKDCDVIVQTDTSISRVHAEINIEKMAAWDPHSGTPSTPSYVRIVDRSKYGTFVNKESGAEGSRLRKDEDTMLKDGDTVTFGTGNVIFRLSFVPIVAFLHGRKPARIDPSLQAVMTSIGAYPTRKWSDECTHVLVDGSCQLTPALIDAVLAKKHIISKDWFKVMAEQNIRTEIPTYAQYVPNLTLDGTEIKMVETKLIENCLVGYSFILGSSDKYNFGDKLHALLELAGAKFLPIDEFSANCEDSVDGDGNQEILVVPARSPLEFNKLRELAPLSKVTDVKLIAAVLSGRLEAAVIEPPAFIVTSSHSTDETIVAESDIEMDTAISNHAATTSKSQRCTDNDFDDKKEITTSSREDPEKSEERKSTVDLHKDSDKVEILKSEDQVGTAIDTTAKGELNSKNEDLRVIDKMVKSDNSEADKNQTWDVIFGQIVVAKNINGPPPISSSEKAVNFKRFRKGDFVSGNSFKDLVPFARDPYKESDDEDKKTSNFMREERKRTQMEAIAEDLFNSKGKKRAAAGASLHALLTGR